MGMPITSYKVLQLLADPTSARGEDEKKLRDTLARFRLLAVVLHDPTRHVGLHDVLTSRFETLDRVTGLHLLFFAFVEVSARWRAGAEHRHYFNTVEKMLQIGYAHATPTPAIDPELSVVSSALALGIPADELPCIVVFRGDASEFCWFGTDASTIERQLKLLALAASNMYPAGAAGRDGVEQYLRDYEIGQRSSSVGEGAGVAARLATILAPSVTDFLSMDDARGDVHRAIEVQKDELQRMLTVGSVGAEDSLLDVAQCALRLGMAIAMSRGGTTQVTWPWPPRELWEIEAAASLATAMKLSTLQDLEIVAPIVICYGRSFEAEINASIVQGLRQRMGVLMPDYFGRHQPAVESRVDVTIGGQPATIDLNAKRSRRWLPPGLGQSEAVARKLGAGNLLEPAAWEMLLQQWTVIRRHRNLAAHDGSSSETSVKACHDAFSHLHSAQVLDAIFELKARLRRSNITDCLVGGRHQEPQLDSLSDAVPDPPKLPYRVPEMRRNGDFIVAVEQVLRSTTRGPRDDEDTVALSENLDRLLTLAGLRFGQPDHEINGGAAANPVGALRAAAAAAKLAVALSASGRDPEREFSLNLLRLNLLLGVAGVRPTIDEQELTRCKRDWERLVHCLIGALSDVASTAPQALRRDTMERYSRACDIVFR